MGRGLHRLMLLVYRYRLLLVVWQRVRWKRVLLRRLLVLQWLCGLLMRPDLLLRLVERQG